MSSTDREPSPTAGAENQSADATAAQQPRRPKRVRHWTAQDRAAHRAFERSRREAFKERLTRLAGEIPSLQQTDPNRLSKHVVLDESTSLHRTQKSEITTSLSQINALLAERDDLLAEVNRWRLGAGVESRQPMNAAMPLPSPQPIRPPSPSNDHDIEDGFTESPPLLHQVASDTVDVNLGSLGPSSTAVANAGHGILASNGADAWDGLAMGLNMAEPPIDLDGMNVDTLVSGPYELPFLRHNGSDNYGMPFQSHHSQILEPSAFLQEDHIRNV